eukprot:GHVU01035706.1.p1 GENE.GHVU01035706.1~~GHVU01035706.1.p1  ORF type:complete len:149 (+),score=32.21 GHVU01035706.1:95-541(+)
MDRSLVIRTKKVKLNTKVKPEYEHKRISVEYRFDSIVGATCAKGIDDLSWENATSLEADGNEMDIALKEEGSSTDVAVCRIEVDACFEKPWETVSVEPMLLNINGKCVAKVQLDLVYIPGLRLEKGSLGERTEPAMGGGHHSDAEFSD